MKGIRPEAPNSRAILGEDGNCGGNNCIYEETDDTIIVLVQ